MVIWTLRWSSLRGKRGSDAWEAIKWLPRFLLMTLCLILIVYIFSVMITVDYDPQGLRVDSALALLAHTDVFSHEHDSRAIALERFTAASIESAIPPLVTEEDSGDDTIVEVLVFPRLAARLTLSSIDGGFEDVEVYYEEESFEQLSQLYVSGARSSIRFGRSENLVRVLDEHGRPLLGQLSIEVVVV